ncbi:UDP-N-acetylmuramoyl-L-alanine--D-glutamate ligase [Arthrobacter sp. JZ12]|uniref:UDP-N-acetylmuramoyl-L-alanine--D-glutamate ligase n=1 Tax=Arthrobacter sp. JZ12 TaxID=2654190 RepID=UPI002B46DD1A|nr:UDP-N-acetylmuramoyl-L-alanine--D-glutamate ligase [Arthrobacter sp. JZ12]WRH24729.1 UDP-N-acetylmuramoyl-L-alanine--D-glutamate ligase [Arthrobacter sp. JZ12]
MGCAAVTGSDASGRLENLTSWDADWKGLRVVVAGIGLSGFSAADTLIELGARVVVCDSTDSEETRAKADTLRIVGAVDVLLGGGAAEQLPEIDGQTPELVVTSPGWRPNQPLLAAAASAGIPIWGDVELAWRVRIREGRPTAEWLTITGTNGKTTTVTLAESMLRAAGLRAIAAGNVGTPLLDAIRDPQGYDVIAVELSSFQLHWSSSIAPLASVCLNLAEDHMDWHGGFEGYRADKAKVYENTKVACVYNVEAPATERMVEEADVQEGCRAIGFTTNTPSISMLGVVDDLLVDRAYIEQRRDSAAELASVSDLGDVVPRHLVANALAAAALVRAAGVPAAAVREGIRNYRPSGHRIELVAARDGVLWINDSKATNPHAAHASLSSFHSVVWIAGGLSKGVDYTDLVRDNASRFRAVVLIGRDSTDLGSALRRHAPDVPVIDLATGHTGKDEQLSQDTELDGVQAMRAAVTEALRLAADGDAVLMAPAAASMDQFPSYAHRGAAFIEAVRGIVEGQGFTAKEL